jgi:hypothetical protein
MNRACVICGGNFKPLGGAKTCSPACSQALEARREHIYRQRSAERRRERYLNDPVYKQKLKAQRLVKRRARAEERAKRHKAARLGDTDARLLAARQDANARGLVLHQRKSLAADLLIKDPTPSNARIAWAAGLSAPVVRLIRSRLERAGTIPAVEVRIDARGGLSPAHKDGPAAGDLEVLARRAITRAIERVGGLRTLEIVLARLPGDVDLAATPYAAISCEHLALSFGSRGTPTAT